MTTAALRLRGSRPALYFLGAVVAAMAVYRLLPDRTAQTALYCTIATAPAVAIAYGILRFRPRARLTWLLVAGGSIANAAGEWLWASHVWFTGQDPPYPYVADYLFLSGYPLFALALVALFRRHGRLRLSELLDATTLVIAAGVVIWAVNIEPILDGPSQGFLQTATTIAYPAMDMLLLAALVYFVFGNATSTALKLVAAGFAATLLTDIIYMRQTVDGTYLGGGWLDLGWIAFYALLAAAGLHPSIRISPRARPRVAGKLPWRRFGILGLAVVAAPATVLLLPKIHRDDIIIAVVAIAVTGLLRVVRMTLLLRDEHSAERARDESAKEAALLTERLRQGEKLEAVGRLAGGIAHDFNNLLLVIRGSCELAVASLPEGSPAADDLARALDGTTRAAEIAGQLLHFSRGDSSSRQLVDVNDVVTESGELLQHLFPEDIDFSVELSPRPVLVLADPGQLVRVLTNLGINARDAMPLGGKLEISAGAEGSHALIRISDTGTGMDAETARHAFDPFFTTKDDKGAGLGLAVVHGIVTQMEGSIDVDTRPGAGTTFTVRLPRASGEPATDDAGPIAPHARERILVVEDEPAVRTVLRRKLESAGFEIVDAEDGEAALAAFDLASPPFDLVLTDVVMPKMGGRELGQILSTRTGAPPVLYMSGYTDDAALRGKFEDGGELFIGKPFTGDELRARVSDVLALSA